MTPSAYRLQFLLAAGNAVLWLGLFAWLAYRQELVRSIAAMMERRI